MTQESQPKSKRDWFHIGVVGAICAAVATMAFMSLLPFIMASAPSAAKLSDKPPVWQICSPHTKQLREQLEQLTTGPSPSGVLIEFCNGVLAMVFEVDPVTKEMYVSRSAPNPQLSKDSSEWVVAGIRAVIYRDSSSYPVKKEEYFDKWWR